MVDALRALTATPPAALRLVTSAMVAEVPTRTKFRPATAPTVVAAEPIEVTAFSMVALMVALDKASTETLPVALIGWPEIEAVAANWPPLVIWLSRSIPASSSARSNTALVLGLPILLKAAVMPTAVSLESTVLSIVAVIAPVLRAPTATLPTVAFAVASPSGLRSIVAVLAPITTFEAITAWAAMDFLSPALVPGFSFDSTLLFTVAVIVPLCSAWTLILPALATVMPVSVAVAALRTSLVTRMPLTATA